MEEQHYCLRAAEGCLGQAGMPEKCKEETGHKRVAGDLPAGVEEPSKKLNADGASSSSSSSSSQNYINNVERPMQECFTPVSISSDNNVSTRCLVDVDIVVRGLEHNLTEDGKSHFCTMLPNDTIRISKESTNEYDKNALIVHLVTPRGTLWKAGYVSKEQAAILSPMISRGCAFTNIRLKEEYETGSSLKLTCKFECTEQDRGTVSSLSQVSHEKRSTVAVRAANGGSYPRVSQNQSVQRTTVPESSMKISKDSKKFIKDRFKEAHSQGDPSAEWVPRSDDELLALGVGNNSDVEYWRERGLHPPCDWRVEAARLMVPDDGLLDDNLRGSSITVDDQRGGTKASKQEKDREEELRGTAWGVENCWLPEHLKDIEELIKLPIWHRLKGSEKKKDQLIAVFGSPYVLGQDVGKLKLVMPHTNKEIVCVDTDNHTIATKKHCMGKNLIYLVVMREKVAEPGFNTLIFGLCWRGSGFG
jgi:hypothetical protein